MIKITLLELGYLPASNLVKNYKKQNAFYGCIGNGSPEVYLISSNQIITLLNPKVTYDLNTIVHVIKFVDLDINVREQ